MKEIDVVFNGGGSIISIVVIETWNEEFKNGTKSHRYRQPAVLKNI